MLAIRDLICLAGVAGIVSSVSGAGVGVRVVAMTGDPAPGTGQAYTYFGPPAINSAGEVSFSAHLTGGIDDSGIWTEGFLGTGSMSLVLREGDPVPGMPGSSFGDVSGWEHVFRMNDAGTLLIRTSIDGVAAPRAIVLRNSGFGHEVIARVGTQVPGEAPGVFWSDFPSMALNESGSVAMSAWVDGPGVSAANDTGVWTDNFGPLSSVLREGDLVPDVIFSTFGQISDAIRLSDDQIAITNRLSVPGDSAWSVQRIDAGGSETIAIAGAPTPTPGYWFHTVDTVMPELSINNAGDVSMLQRVTMLGGQGDGLFMGQGDLDGVLYDADQTWDPSIYIYEFEGAAAPLNTASDSVFSVRLHGFGVNPGNNSAMMRRDAGGDLKLVVREGDQPAGVGAGVKYLSSAEWMNALNNAGQVAFTSRIIGPGVTVDNDTGLWATTPYEGTVLLIREGSVIEVAPGDFRTVDSYTTRYLTAGPEDGHRAPWNDAGELAAKLTFDDGSQAVVVFTTPQGCIGDMNGDFEVDFMDLNILLDNWATFGEPGTIPGDIDADGAVDFSDLTEFLEHWGDVCQVW